jgi:class 3 adenylate cyclase
MKELAARWRASGHKLGFGVAIANGFATIGSIGFEGRRDYSAIGMVVNLAARLCAEASDEQILVDSKVRAAIESSAKLEPCRRARPQRSPSHGARLLPACHDVAASHLCTDVGGDADNMQ